MSFFTRTALASILTLVTVAGSRAEDGATGTAPRPTIQVAHRVAREFPSRPPLPSRTLPADDTSPPADAAPEPAPAPPPVAEPSPASDPYGFAAILNAYRASAGLHPLAYDPDLSNWAAHNNAAQASRGLGHHVLPNCFQNCGWNYADAWSVALDWMNSPGHRSNMLAPSATRFGIAYGPGPYWTLNAQ